jgi:putative multiple sugar transport system ATP-binding protein
MDTAILEMKHITKTFPGVVALSDVNFNVQRGEIHCLVGENGAGKSTLMKVLSGVYPHGDYEGEIIFDGKIQRFRDIADSERAGIAIIYQELALVPEMTVYENILLGNEIKKGFGIDWNKMIQRSNELLAKVRLKINPEIKVKDLGVGKRQLVEIAKALSRDVSLLILDEPTAALNEDDCDNLLDLIVGLKKSGVTCVLISHKLREVIRIADKVTVLRDGKTIVTLDAGKDEVNEGILIKHMVGREITNIYPPRKKRELIEAGDVALETRQWSAVHPQSGRQVLENISITARKGEIIGIAGLMGSGRTELARSIFGNPDEYRLFGELFVGGKSVAFAHPEQAIRAGVAYATEDRKGNGLILIQDIKGNITLANLGEIAKRGVTVDRNKEIKAAEKYREMLNIKTPSVEQKVVNLSGGNQQKVSVAKWLFAKPDVLIFDEPTRGIDVGAKYEIYCIMNDLAAQGMCIIMISSELPEILGMSDRIYIVSSGKISGELSRAEATQEKIMRMATNY